MGEPEADRNVYVFELGEAFDDMRPAFYVDDREYPDADLARVAVETAEAVMTRTGVLFGMEIRSGSDALAPAGLPTWEQFYRRHFVEGIPLSVRPQPATFDVPQSWPAMRAEMARADEDLYAELTHDLEEVFPGSRVHVEAHAGPTRYSAGAVRLAEELYGFTIQLAVAVEVENAVESVIERLARSGWEFAQSGGGRRDLFQISVRTHGPVLRVTAYSPLYQATDQPAGKWSVQERPADS
jgi:hypothetical protein